MSLMSVKSVPGCFVMIAPSLIGWPVAFFPLPRPHFDAGAVDFGAAADPPPPLSLSSSPHATRNAGSANATQSSAASDRAPLQVFLRTDPPPEIWLEGAHRPPPPFAERTAVRRTDATRALRGVSRPPMSNCPTMFAPGPRPPENPHTRARARAREGCLATSPRRTPSAQRTARTYLGRHASRGAR